MASQFQLQDEYGEPVTTESITCPSKLEFVVRYHNDDLYYNETNGYLVNHCCMVILNEDEVELLRADVFGFNTDRKLRASITAGRMVIQSFSPLDHLVVAGDVVYTLASMGSISLEKGPLCIAYKLFADIMESGLYDDVFAKYTDELKSVAEWSTFDIDPEELQ